MHRSVLLAMVQPQMIALVVNLECFWILRLAWLSVLKENLEIRKLAPVAVIIFFLSDF